MRFGVDPIPDRRLGALVSRARLLLYALSFGLFALALASKTTACTLPAAQLLLLWLRGHAIGARRMLQIGPFLALGLAMGLVTIFWERFQIGTVGARFSLDHVIAQLENLYSSIR